MHHTLRSVDFTPALICLFQSESILQHCYEFPSSYLLLMASLVTLKLHVLPCLFKRWLVTQQTLVLFELGGEDYPQIEEQTVPLNVWDEEAFSRIY